MKTLANFHEDKDSWVKERKGRIGASEASAAVGVNPHKSPFELWAEKVGLKEAEELTSQAIVWGNRLETPIAEGWAEDTGNEIIQSGDLVPHDQHDWLVATPDFYVGEKELLECKLSGSPRIAELFQDGDTPDHFQTQCIVQLACTKRQAAHLAALLGGTRMEMRTIYRDEFIESLVIEQLEKFWELVKTKTPPPLIDSDNDLVSSIYPVDPHKEVPLSADTDLLCEMFLKARDAEKAAESKKKALQAEIKRRLEGARKAYGESHNVTLTEVKTTNIDVERLKAERKSIAAKYSKFGSYQRMTVRKIKTKKEA